MMKVLIAAVFLLFGSVTGRPPGQSSLDRVVAAEHPISLRGVPLDKLVASRLSILSRSVGLLVGFEEAQDPAAASAPSLASDLRGATVREALDRLVAADPRYEWREMDGMVIVRSVKAWADCSHFMNRDVEVTARDLHGAEAIALLFLLIDPTVGEGRPMPGGLSAGFTVEPFQGTVLQAFNHLARAGRLSWRVAYGPHNAGDARVMSLTLAEMEGPQTGFSRPLRPLRATCGPR